MCCAIQPSGRQPQVSPIVCAAVMFYYIDTTLWYKSSNKSSGGLVLDPRTPGDQWSVRGPHTCGQLKILLRRHVAETFAYAIAYAIAYASLRHAYADRSTPHFCKHWCAHCFPIHINTLYIARITEHYMMYTHTLYMHVRCTQACLNTLST